MWPAETAERDRPEEAAELRKLVSAILVDGGLEPAVRSAAGRSLVSTTVEVKDLGDYPDEIVTAVYLCCAEALQNVNKHAREARSAHLVLREANNVLSSGHD